MWCIIFFRCLQNLPNFIFSLSVQHTPLISILLLNMLPSLAYNLPLPPWLAGPSFTLPQWYFIVGKQEAGEQTAGETILILSCAICCCHMTELQTRSKAMMPHHTWHIDQSWPKYKTENERGGWANWKETTVTINAKYTKPNQLWLSNILSFVLIVNLVPHLVKYAFFSGTIFLKIWMYCWENVKKKAKT